MRMPLTKKRRNRLWYAYVAAMLLAYEAPMIAFGYSLTSFMIAFPAIAAITAGFIILMRRLSRA